MLQVLGRAMNGSTVEGYVVTDSDNIQNIMVTKQDLWLRAKDKMVYNVEASGSIENPVLTGTNGFQLKSLPTIKARTKIDSTDLHACYIRHMVAGEIPTEGSLNGRMEMAKKYFKAEQDNGVANAYIIGSLSDFIEEVYTLGDMCNDGAIIDTSAMNNVDTSRSNVSSNIVGYVLRNIGNVAIPVVRITATPDHTQSIVMLNPGQTIALSRAEMAILASRIEFGGKFSNAKLCMSSRMNGNVHPYEVLKHCYTVHRDKDGDIIHSHDRAIKRRVDEFATQEEMNTYFEIRYDSVGQTLKTSSTVNVNASEKLKGAKSVKGMFNAFKR